MTKKKVAKKKSASAAERSMQGVDDPSMHGRRFGARLLRVILARNDRVTHVVIIPPPQQRRACRVAVIPHAVAQQRRTERANVAEPLQSKVEPFAASMVVRVHKSRRPPSNAFWNWLNLHSLSCERS